MSLQCNKGNPILFQRIPCLPEYRSGVIALQPALLKLFCSKNLSNSHKEAGSCYFDLRMINWIEPRKMKSKFYIRYSTISDRASLIFKESIFAEAGFIDVGVNKLMISRIPLIS